MAQLSGLQSQVPAGQEFNEHVWYSFPTVKKVADTIAVDLGQADPAQAATFTANAQAFDTKIDGLTAKLDAVKAKHAGAQVAITEPVPLYMVPGGRAGQRHPAASSPRPSRRAPTRPRPSCRTR